MVASEEEEENHNAKTLVASPPPPPHTPSTSVVSPGLSIQSSGNNLVLVLIILATAHLVFIRGEGVLVESEEILKNGDFLRKMIITVTVIYYFLTLFCRMLAVLSWVIIRTLRK